MIITKKEGHNSLFLYNNIFLSDNEVIYKNTTESDWFIDDSNLYWDYTNGEKVYSGDSTKLVGRVSVKQVQNNGLYNNGVFADPYFKDIENRDFSISLASPAIESGFEPWDYDAGTRTLFE